MMPPTLHVGNGLARLLTSQCWLGTSGHSENIIAFAADNLRRRKNTKEIYCILAYMLKPRGQTDLEAKILVSAS